MTDGMVMLNRNNHYPQDPQAQLERAYIEAYLSDRGYQLRDIPNLAAEFAKSLMVEACIFASTKLAEIEERSRFVHALHGEYDH